MIPLIPGIIPVQFFLVAKVKAMLKISSMSDAEVLQSATTSNVNCTIEEIRAAFASLEEWNLVQVDRTDSTQEIYANMKDFVLSEKGELVFSQKVQPILDWGIQTWQSFYNIRELDVKIPDSYLWADHFAGITSRAATQGFSSAYFVIKNIANYFEAIYNGEINPPQVV